MSKLVKSEPSGTLFSMSLGVTEQTFGGAAKVQTARFDKVFQAGLAKHDNFFAATGDFGTYNASKKHRETVSYPFPTAGWASTSPYVVAVGGTQLQHGWTWDPTSNTAFNSNGSFNPAYWNWTNGGHSQAVWNESRADRNGRRRQRRLLAAVVADGRRSGIRRSPSGARHGLERGRQRWR